MNKGDDKSAMPSDEFMEKKHARFVILNDAKKKTNTTDEHVRNLNEKKASYATSTPAEPSSLV